MLRRERLKRLNLFLWECALGFENSSKRFVRSLKPFAAYIYAPKTKTINGFYGFRYVLKFLLSKFEISRHFLKEPLKV
jgi:hypothetical protein